MSLFCRIQSHLNIKLAWSVTESVSAEVDSILSRTTDKEVLIGRRLDVNAFLTADVQAG